MDGRAVGDGMREYVVGVWHHPENAGTRGEWVASVRPRRRAWAGMRTFTVHARTGAEAKALALRRATRDQTGAGVEARVRGNLDSIRVQTAP